MTRLYDSKTNASRADLSTCARGSLQPRTTSQSVGHMVPRIIQHDNLLPHDLHRRFWICKLNRIPLYHCFFTERIFFVSQIEFGLNSIVLAFFKLNDRDERPSAGRPRGNGVALSNIAPPAGVEGASVTTSRAAGMTYTQQVLLEISPEMIRLNDGTGSILSRVQYILKNTALVL